MSNNRVVITGMGILSSIGNDLAAFSKNLFSGKSGISEIESFDTSEHKIKIGSEVKVDFEKYFNSKELNKLDRFSALSIIAANQAIKQSGIGKVKNKDNIGVIIGSGIGGIHTIEDQHKKLLSSPRKVSPFFIPSMILDIAAGQISITHGFKGTNFSIVSACASSNHAIGESFNNIKYGISDAIITGGSEGGITPLSVAGFSNMKALSTNPDPNSASKPFDKNRDGFVIGEGSGILVLESLSHAQKRNANILAEIVGYGSSADAHHVTSPDPSGDGAFRSMKNAITDANILPTDIDYINAHGTSTHYNDKVETLAIKNLFNSHAKNLSISSTKSMIGHLLGAAGGVEAIASILSITESKVPPTINYNTPDEECDLNYTPNKSVNKSINFTLSNNFGFGGHNATLIFKKYLD